MATCPLECFGLSSETFPSERSSSALETCSQACPYSPGIHPLKRSDFYCLGFGCGFGFDWESWNLQQETSDGPYL